VSWHRSAPAANVQRPETRHGHPRAGLRPCAHRPADADGGDGNGLAQVAFRTEHLGLGAGLEGWKRVLVLDELGPMRWSEASAEEAGLEPRPLQRLAHH